MSSLIHSSSWVLSAVLVVVPTIIFCLVSLLFVRKMVTTETLRKNHDVAGFTFSIVGVLYSVVLGFTVVSSQERYNDVEKNILTEAFMIADLYRDASFFPTEKREAIRFYLREYITFVVEKEWWLPAEKKSRFQSQEITDKLWETYYSIDLENRKMGIWYNESISKLNNFMNANLARQFSSWNRLGSMMWALLIVGGFITICFMFFFGLENLRCQMLMTSLLAGYLSFMLFLVYSLDHVFKGPAGIKPIIFEQLGVLFDRWDKDLVNVSIHVQAPLFPESDGIHLLQTLGSAP